jgi:hypothetical protein
MGNNHTRCCLFFSAARYLARDTLFDHRHQFAVVISRRSLKVLSCATDGPAAKVCAAGAIQVVAGGVLVCCGVA